MFHHTFFARYRASCCTFQFVLAIFSFYLFITAGIIITPLGAEAQIITPGAHPNCLRISGGGVGGDYCGSARPALPNGGPSSGVGAGSFTNTDSPDYLFFGKLGPRVYLPDYSYLPIWASNGTRFSSSVTANGTACISQCNSFRFCTRVINPSYVIPGTYYCSSLTNVTYSGALSPLDVVPPPPTPTVVLGSGATQTKLNFVGCEPGAVVVAGAPGRSSTARSAADVYDADFCDGEGKAILTVSSGISLANIAVFAFFQDLDFAGEYLISDENVLGGGPASPTPTASPSASRAPSATVSPSATSSRTPSPSASRTPSATMNPSATSSRTPSPSASISPAPSLSASPTRTPTTSPSASATPISCGTYQLLGATGSGASCPPPEEELFHIPPNFPSLVDIANTDENRRQAVYSVSLLRKPIKSVKIPLASSNPNEGVVAPAFLTFGPLNWNIPQNITVTGVDDPILDGDKAYSIVFSPAISLDPVFNGKKPEDIGLLNFDNEVGSIIVEPSTRLTTSESGQSDTFSVKLGIAPLTNVFLSVRSSRTSEGTVNRTSLTFTPANWNTAQPVRVTGVPDSRIDDDLLYTVIVTPAKGSNNGYLGVEPKVVEVLNKDVDADMRKTGLGVGSMDSYFATRFRLCPGYVADNVAFPKSWQAFVNGLGISPCDTSAVSDIYQPAADTWREIDTFNAEQSQILLEGVTDSRKALQANIACGTNEIRLRFTYDYVASEFRRPICGFEIFISDSEFGLVHGVATDNTGRFIDEVPLGLARDKLGVGADGDGDGERVGEKIYPQLDSRGPNGCFECHSRKSYVNNRQLLRDDADSFWPGLGVTIPTRILSNCSCVQESPTSYKISDNSQSSGGASTGSCSSACAQSLEFACDYGSPIWPSLRCSSGSALPEVGQ